MKIQIKATCYDGIRSMDLFAVDMGPELPALHITRQDAPIIEKAIGHLKRNKRLYLTTCYALALLTLPGGPVAAAGSMSGGMNIILLLQKASFWIGMGVTIWGLIEMGLDAPGWKARVFKGILLYVGVLIVPVIFLELQNSLQVNVWDQINGVKVNGGP